MIIFFHRQTCFIFEYIIIIIKSWFRVPIGSLIVRRPNGGHNQLGKTGKGNRIINDCVRLALTQIYMNYAKQMYSISLFISYFKKIKNLFFYVFLEILYLFLLLLILLILRDFWWRFIYVYFIFKTNPL